MNARDEIFTAIRNRRSRHASRPPAWRAREPDGDPIAAFAGRASAAAARVTILAHLREAPACVADILRARNMPAVLHLPPDPQFDEWMWTDVPGLVLLTHPPGPDDVALAIASFGIAETGTLVYCASRARPPSWHFRAGLEIALLSADTILPDLEQVVARVKSGGSLPSTLNLVTGPSRTGDIEQTLELGAHGPKELVILIVPSCGPPAFRVD
jgi:L-lactate dehydrogenase complex protein LldG